MFELAAENRLKIVIKTLNSNNKMFACTICYTPIMWMEAAFDGPIDVPFIYCENQEETFCKFENGALYCRGCNAALSWTTRDPYKILRSRTEFVTVHDAWMKAYNYICRYFAVARPVLEGF